MIQVLPPMSALAPMEEDFLVPTNVSANEDDVTDADGVTDEDDL